MAMTFGFQLATQPNKKGLYPVVLRITQDRKQKKVRTTFEVKKSDWNQNANYYKHFRQSYPDYAKANAELKKLIERYEEKNRELAKKGESNAEIITLGIKEDEKSTSFLTYAKERTQDIYDTGGIRNWKKYNGFCNKLEKFLKKSRKSDLLFSELTPAFISKFNSFLHKLPNERNPNQLLHPNSIEVVLNIFKTLVNRAIEIDGLIKPEQNPFLKFKYSGVKTAKEKLSADEIEAIANLQLAEDSLIWHCRNYFFFSFYCAGIRAGDLIQLRWNNITSDGRLNYEMGKNHKFRDLILVDQAKDILKLYYKEGVKGTDYIFPLLDNDLPWASAITQDEKDTLPAKTKEKMFALISSKNALINKELGKIAKQAKIEKKLTFHISRHSFAKVAKEKGIDNLSVKALLGHSKIETTERYMGSFDTERNDQALASIFEKDKEQQDKKAVLLEKLEGLDEQQIEAILAIVNKGEKKE